ncbi:MULTISPECIES: T9SS ring complex lipoprotein PorK/GldK [Flectobacillus]|jgi:gliding motility-associated lipoprotein GldK|uniref:SUMF1/EgtB/PvdO family nonheme iron enzyme n=1 Tax=Flectobacillus roseus TaxID=502259 RepID=A0ABT6YEU5_9BACT|nr:MULTISPECIES: SUMF1/EgtB/PvdO family nonheme iron enzyme [Flectobacillus]MDI9862116.1 SUMF1/EgtB/PvdO family nonheme iron enzyme [Flectobacillus roseus]MDI9870413.1 SUMF1/EgtB/PvdO family nonheme iron enzyme [Flectobacillus roseus]NBA74949.1 SUMF1/EgtB/PvdO family nonheme iron enzyme [Emticicia sp. ODNR4P]PAC31982.1 gliding motility protein [Flectobacillus sp. BAB-3569]
MNYSVIFRKTLLLILLAVPVLLLDSCSSSSGKKGGKTSSSKSKSGKGREVASKGKGGKKGRNSKKDDIGMVNGEVAATARKGWKQTTPLGMVLIPSGSYMMGQADEDIVSSSVNFNKRVSVAQFFLDDTEISNNEYRQFTTAMLTDSISVLGEEKIMSEYYPDTTVWSKDFSYHNGDPMTEYYFSSPAFDLYPVVGVSWRAAKYFCEWRTKALNDYRTAEGMYISPRYRLPSEAEWEWAARGGKASAKYPWGNPYVANGKGCLLANFKPHRGNYDSDGYAYTAPVNAYNPNDYGLYNMAGNVAEWCIDAYSDNAVAITWDLNTLNDDKDEPRKVIRGGSWKDVAYYLETGTRSYEYEDKKRSYIGFRCAMTHLGRSSGKEFR